MNTTRSLSMLLLTAGLVAQTPVFFPSDHATIANGASSSTQFPYSYGVSRMMALYESWDLGVPAGHQITRIGFRADGTTIAYGRSLQLEVRMGQSNRTSATMLTNYDSNYLGAATTVYGPALFTLPDLNNVLNPNPDGPYVWLTLTTPYTFDPTQNLLVEWRILANSNGGAAFSYALDRATYESPIVTGSPGCAHSGGQTPQLLSRASKVGGTWYNDLSRGPGNQPVILFLNVGVPLVAPYPLSALLPGVQAGCQGQVSPIALFSLPSTTGATGNKTFSVPVPNNRFLNDLVLSSQAFCYDFFSPGGIVVSNGDQITLGIDPAMTLLWSQGSATATTGTAYRNWGVVTVFDHN